MTDFDVPRETRERLDRYVALLQKWNQAINLIGGGESEIWDRHILDSYQLVFLIPSTAKTLLDIGSGGGLPGLVIAIATDLEVTLVERDQRKAAFLREAQRTLDLRKVTVVEKDIKNLEGTFDVITARAFSSLKELCEVSAPRMGTDSICLFPKGENFATELDQAGQGWSFEAVTVPSKTRENSSIVSLSKLKRKG